MKPKQIIVMRTDLKMRKGKMIAQGAHASLKVLLDAGSYHHLTGAVLEGPSGEDRFDRVLREVRAAEHSPTLRIPLDPSMEAWLMGAFTKVCVRVESEAELDAVYEAAKAAGLPCALIFLTYLISLLPKKLASISQSGVIGGTPGRTGVGQAPKRRITS